MSNNVDSAVADWIGFTRSNVGKQIAIAKAANFTMCENNDVTTTELINKNQKTTFKNRSHKPMVSCKFIFHTFSSFFVKFFFG